MKKILIVEDELPLREALVDKLKLEGIETIEASNGEEGLRIALQEKPDMILLDVIMPVMDGITMLKKLREDSWGEGVRVLVLSNLSEGDKVEEAMNEGAFDYLVKSNWKIGDVIDKVKEKL